MNYPINRSSIAPQEDALPPRILVIHGPNLNLLGLREPHLYGTSTLDEINRKLLHHGQNQGFWVDTFQSNSEGALVDRVHRAATEGTLGIVLNAGAYTHTSVALRDAISAVSIPTVEIHLTNLYQREEFRHRSLLAPVCIGVIMGFRLQSYILGLTALIEYLQNDKR